MAKKKDVLYKFEDYIGTSLEDLMEQYREEHGEYLLDGDLIEIYELVGTKKLRVSHSLEDGE